MRATRETSLPLTLPNITSLLLVLTRRGDGAVSVWQSSVRTRIQD